jgi:hypothetical protein
MIIISNKACLEVGGAQVRKSLSRKLKKDRPLYAELCIFRNKLARFFFLASHIVSHLLALLQMKKSNTVVKLCFRALKLFFYSIGSIITFVIIVVQKATLFCITKPLTF